MKRLTPDADDARFLRRLVLLIVVLAVTVAIYRAGNLLVIAFGSILGAITIHAVADWLEARAKLPHRLALCISTLGAIGLFGFLVWLLTMQFGQQINELIVQIPVLADRLAAWMSQSQVGAKIVAAARTAYAGSQAAQDVGALARSGLDAILYIILLIVGSLFFAIEPRRYRDGLLLLVPRDKRPAFADAFADLEHTLRLWLRAQIILMAIMGVLIGIGLWISGVPSAAALGLLAGLSEFIPYIGPTVAMLPALGLAATAGTGPLVGALVTYAVVRLVHDNGITPYIQGKVVRIPPAVTLFSIVAIGLVFGVGGLIFSAPLLVAIYALVRSLYLRETIGEELPDLD